jgi:hypothetical protein
MRPPEPLFDRPGGTRMLLCSMTEAPPTTATSRSRWAVSTISRSVRSGEIRDTEFRMLM